jgi:hypothetical protein
MKGGGLMPRRKKELMKICRMCLEDFPVFRLDCNKVFCSPDCRWIFQTTPLDKRERIFIAGFLLELERLEGRLIRLADLFEFNSKMFASQRRDAA